MITVIIGYNIAFLWAIIASIYFMINGVPFNRHNIMIAIGPMIILTFFSFGFILGTEVFLK